MDLSASFYGDLSGEVNGMQHVVVSLLVLKTEMKIRVSEDKEEKGICDIGHCFWDFGGG